MIERAWEIIDVGAEVPEVLERDVAVELVEVKLFVAAVVELRLAAQGNVVALIPTTRLRLAVAQAGKSVAAVRVAQPPGIIRVVRRRLPAVLEIVQPVALRLPKPHVADRSA